MNVYGSSLGQTNGRSSDHELAVRRTQTIRRGPSRREKRKGQEKREARSGRREHEGQIAERRGVGNTTTVSIGDSPTGESCNCQTLRLMLIA